MAKTKYEKQLESRLSELEKKLQELQSQLLSHLTNHPYIWYYTSPYVVPTVTTTPNVLPLTVGTPAPYTVGDLPSTITWTYSGPLPDIKSSN